VLSAKPHGQNQTRCFGTNALQCTSLADSISILNRFASDFDFDEATYLGGRELLFRKPYDDENFQKFVSSRPSWVFSSTVGAMRCDQTNVMCVAKLLVRRMAVIGSITDYGVRFGFGEELRDGGFDELGFMRRSAGDAADNRKTMAVCDRHDFAAFSTASRADSSAPFFAALELASMKVSERSSLPRARRSSASACNSRVSVPSRCHC
jgi:hypothetical protein